MPRRSQEANLTALLRARARKQNNRGTRQTLSAPEAAQFETERERRRQEVQTGTIVPQDSSLRKKEYDQPSWAYRRNWY